jgi:hypothetical protein
MKKKILISLAIIITLFGSASLVFGWGVWGHNHINKGAVLSLPAEMGMFFYNHTDFLVEESTVPDIRKHVLEDKAEGCRHYIDLENYNYLSRADMPKTLTAAIAIYGKD